MSKRVTDLLQTKFGASILETHAQFGDDTVIVEPARWREVALFLRDEPRIAMNMFTDLCGVDYLGMRETRFEVVCHLRSLQHAHRIRIKARVGDEEGNGAEIDSLVPVWKGANWFERETYDLMGIVFKGHPDLRRILMYPEFTGHPLRRDYPHDRIEPLVPFRAGIVGKLPPFGPDEGAPFGRQAHDYRREDMRSYSQDAVGHPLPVGPPGGDGGVLGRGDAGAKPLTAKGGES
jgi:NADH-quinone oxidoreductase subunit C